MEIFGIPHQAFLGQLLLGLVNGAFYAMLSLGLAVIFGLLGIVNFAHGALYMLGAFAAWIMLDKFGINYWYALVLAPLTVGALGVVIERLFLKHLYKIDPIYGLLLTLGLRPELRCARTVVRRDQPRLHGPAQLPCLGGAGITGGVPGHLVLD
jgi:branched-chain amino acid transport system permease protein